MAKKKKKKSSSIDGFSSLDSTSEWDDNEFQETETDTEPLPKKITEETKSKKLEEKKSINRVPGKARKFLNQGK